MTPRQRTAVSRTKVPSGPKSKWKVGIDQRRPGARMGGGTGEAKEAGRGQRIARRRRASGIGGGRLPLIRIRARSVMGNPLNAETPAVGRRIETQRWAGADAKEGHGGYKSEIRRGASQAAGLVSMMMHSSETLGTEASHLAAFRGGSGGSYGISRRASRWAGGREEAGTSTDRDQSRGAL